MEMNEYLILTRQALYRFYAGLLLYPEEERLQTLKGAVSWLAEAIEDKDVVGTLKITDAMHKCSLPAVPDISQKCTSVCIQCWYSASIG